MTRSPRRINEEIESLELRRGRYVLEAKTIYETCLQEKRDLSDDEDAIFKEITNDNSGLIAECDRQLATLRNELEQAVERERRIVAASAHGGKEVFMFGTTNRPEKVLPTNGVLPGDKPNFRNVGRIAKLKAFRSEETAFDAGQWLKAVVSRTHFGVIDERAEQYCSDRGLSLTNVGSEGVGPAGGYVVPAPLAATIIDVRELVGAARKICRVMPMTADTLTVPRRDTGLTVYAPGEVGTITDSDKAWKQIQLIAKKRAVLSYISQELNDDAIINVVDDLFSEMGHALALQEDKELINGDGSGATYFGVSGLLANLGAGGVSTAATGHDTWPELDIADFAACVSKLPDRYHAYGPVWVCSHAFFNATMARIAYSAGGVSMAEVMSGSPNVRSFMGYPVILTSQMPTSTATATVCALFGAFTQAVILGDRGGVRLARSDDFAFSQDKIALRATSRYDFNVFDAGTASAAGAFVALKTAS